MPYRKPKCAQCNQKCDRALIDGVFYEVNLCTCSRLFCGTCTHNYRKCRCLRKVRQEYPLLSKFCSFAKNAPEDELKLVDLQVSLDAKCLHCGVGNSPVSRLYRNKIHQLVCSACAVPPVGDHLWVAWSITDRIFYGFVMSIARVGSPKNNVHLTELKLPVKIRNLYCFGCRVEIGSTSNISCRPFILDGNVYCYDCGANTCMRFSESQRCLCLCKFIDCIECIPENQLHLLTYSKWVKAVGCELHENILDQLIAEASDGSRIGKLRTFFKYGGNTVGWLPSVRGENRHLNDKSVMKSSATTSNKANELRLMLSKVDVSTPVTPVTTILCPCGREEDISNMFVCDTCSVHGVCALCITRNHWGHDIQNNVKTMVDISSVNIQSEFTLHKLRQWSGQAKELNQQGEKAFQRLCRVLGDTFVDAMVNNEDEQRIQILLEKTNTSTLEAFFKDTVNSTTKLHKAIDYFCADLTLTNANEEAKENIDTTVQELSSVESSPVSERNFAPKKGVAHYLITLRKSISRATERK